MATLIQKPTTIQAAGQPPKLIEEFIGRMNSGTTAVSIARMKSPSGWSEPGQTPKFVDTNLHRPERRRQPARGERDRRRIPAEDFGKGAATQPLSDDG